MMEGLVNGFPVELLLMGFPISEFLALGFALPEIGAYDDLFEGTAMDSKPEISKGRQRVQIRKQKREKNSKRLWRRRLYGFGEECFESSDRFLEGRL